MPDDNEIENNTVPPTKEFIRNALQYGLISNGDLVTGLTGEGISSQQYASVEYLSRNRGKVVRFLIKLAYANKEMIKSLPVLRRWASKIQERMMKQNRTYQAALDLSPILGLDINDFIQSLYLRALGRVPDPENLNEARRALLGGLPREALAYMVCTSPEFAGRMEVLHLNEYRRIYSRYILRERIKKLPGIGRIWAMFALPGRVSRLSSQMEAVDTRVESVNIRVESVNIRVESVEKQLASLIAAVDIANQNVINANVKIDQTAILIIDAFNKNKPVVYGIPGGVTVIQMEKFIFGVPSEEWRLAKYLSQGGTFEPGTEKYFCSIIRNGMVVLDVGAYLGIYTLHALTAGCNVYSYEPTASIYKILSDNVGINGFEPTGRAHLYNLVVSDSEGEVDFALFSNGQNNSIFTRDEENKSIRLRSVCLDTHLNKLDRVDVVKIDVEGAEPLVLRGMKGIIANNPQIKIIMEFAPSNLKRGGTDPKDFLTAIRAMKMSIHEINEGTGQVLNIEDDELCKAFSVNVLLQRLDAKE